MNINKLIFCLAVILMIIMAFEKGSLLAVNQIETETINIQVNGREIEVITLTIPAGISIKPDIALGEDRVGGVEELAAMAERRQALLAVNGTFFNPEDYTNGQPTEPYGTLIKRGRVIHVGNNGATLGFDKRGNISIEQLRIQIKGGTKGSFDWPNNWYAYGFNHTPGGPTASSVFIYTPERGSTVGFDYGTKVVVSRGSVSKIVKNRDARIPADGYVIVMTGAERQLEKVFRVGKRVDYRVIYKTAAGKRVNFDYELGLGAGPMLVEDGKILTDYQVQGFKSQKILTQRGRRSAFGIKRDDSIIIALAGATTRELAEIMKTLGAVRAMNLDGGASSGLWYNGDYLYEPGRKLSNALLIQN